MNESEMATNVISDLHRQVPCREADLEPEVPYNNYGDRGVVDLVVEEWSDNGQKTRGNTQLYIYELKSEYALENATGANEIIRQFQRHKEHFFKGTDQYHEHKYWSVNFRLLFYATEELVNHVRENKSLYKSVEEGSMHGTSYFVQFYHENLDTIVRPVKEPIWKNRQGEQLREVIA